MRHKLDKLDFQADFFHTGHAHHNPQLKRIIWKSALFRAWSFVVEKYANINQVKSKARAKLNL